MLKRCPYLEDILLYSWHARSIVDDGKEADSAEVRRLQAAVLSVSIVLCLSMTSIVS